MRHACYLKGGVAWRSVGEAKKPICVTQSDLENNVLFGKENENSDYRFSEMIGESIES